MIRSGFIALASLLAISSADVTAVQAKVKIDLNIGTGGGGISCKRGAYILADEGYYRIVPLDCEGRYYEYRARRNGKSYILRMSSRSGDIVDRQRIH